MAAVAGPLNPRGTVADPTGVLRCLVVSEPWITAILEGRKTWEMRSRRTSIRGRVGLIRTGSGTVVATTAILDSPDRLDGATFRASRQAHAIPAALAETAIAAGWTCPRILGPVDALDPPVPYAHPRGAVTWVRVPWPARDA